MTRYIRALYSLFAPRRDYTALLLADLGLKR